ncbi:MAG: SDR family oxidoreductase [Chitinophagales bacterium]|nr:SDR family oxidoreductase [Chitinophagales bacterium]
MYENSNFHSGKDLSSLKFLISGGAGFIGSHLVQYLMENNAGLVRVIDNLETGFKENLSPYLNAPNFEFFEKDIRVFENCVEACEGIDYVSHQAALGSVPRSIKNPLATHQANVDGFLNMLIAARDSNVKKFVFASSSSVYGDSPILPKVEEQIGKPLSPYAVTKFTNELYGKIFYDTYQFPVIGFRYFNVFGQRQNPHGAYAAVIPLFINKLLSNEVPIIDGDGQQTRDFTFIENVVQINIKAMLSENKDAFGQIFNVATGHNYSVLHMFDSMQKTIGTKFESAHRETRSGDIRNSLADISKATNLLNYQPQVQFEEGLERTITYFRELNSK